MRQLFIAITKFQEKKFSILILNDYKSGFEDNQDCIYAWSKKGEKVYGEQEEKRGKRENLVAGRRKKEKDLIAPIIFNLHSARQNVVYKTSS